MSANDRFPDGLALQRIAKPQNARCREHRIAVDDYQALDAPGMHIVHQFVQRLRLRDRILFRRTRS